MTLILLFAVPNTWCQRAMAKKADGTSLDNIVLPQGTTGAKATEHMPKILEELAKPDYVQFCLVGALLKCYGPVIYEPGNPVVASLKAVLIISGTDRIAVFNDKVAKSIEDIRRVVKLAKV